MTTDMELPESPVGSNAPRPSGPAASASECSSAGAQQPVGNEGKELVLSSFAREMARSHSSFVRLAAAAQPLMSSSHLDLGRAFDAVEASWVVQTRDIWARVIDMARPFQQASALTKMDLFTPRLSDWSMDQRFVTSIMRASALANGFGRSAKYAAATQKLAQSVLNIADINAVIGSVSAMVSDLEQIYRLIADSTRWALRPIAPSVDLDWVLRTWLLAAAQHARQDFLATGSLDAVAEFAFDWLGLKPARRFRETTLEAVVDVLLGEDWDSSDVHRVQTHDELRKRLRMQVSDAHCRWRPTWTRKLMGMPIGSLNVPTLLPGGGETDLGNLVPAGVDVESTVMRGLDCMQERLRVPLRSLSAPEQTVAWMVANDLTWTEATQTVGLPASAGRKIERKVKRLARQYVQRQGARDETVGRTVAP